MLGTPLGREPLVRLADGTVKQVNPFTGTQVWSVPGRGHRPLPTASGPHAPIDPLLAGHHCAFCEGRYLDTTPEKVRYVEDAPYVRLTDLTAEQLDETVAQFRVIPNLFEIVSLDYWRLNHGYETSDAGTDRRDAYLATPLGREHVERLLKVRAAASPTAYGEFDRRQSHESVVDSFFGGFHDVVVARRHYVDGATTQDQLAGSGTLSEQEHRAYVAIAIEAMQRMFARNPMVMNVSVFQNWLQPAGASFDHLHKQVVALDTLGRRRELELGRLADNPELFRDYGIAMAQRLDLIVAENDHAVAYAGVGHRFPSVQVWTRRLGVLPWELAPAELDAWSDLVRLCHIATGNGVPTNEEWHYRPPGIPDAQMPFRAVLKWRINTSAGFEGGTGIHVNTIDPWTVTQRARESLARAGEGAGV
jgi:galactose-1-phosphate uridylyltransferase